MSAPDITDPEPVASIRASRRTGHAVVTVTRGGRTCRYVVSLRRYRALREWTVAGAHPWRSSGAWLRSGLRVYLWTRPGDGTSRESGAGGHVL